MPNITGAQKLSSCQAKTHAHPPAAAAQRTVLAMDLFIALKPVSRHAIARKAAAAAIELMEVASSSPGAPKGFMRIKHKIILAASCPAITKAGIFL